MAQQDMANLARRQPLVDLQSVHAGHTENGVDAIGFEQRDDGAPASFICSHARDCILRYTDTHQPIRVPASWNFPPLSPGPRTDTDMNYEH